LLQAAHIKFDSTQGLGLGPRTGPRLIKKYKIILKLEKLTSGYKDTFLF